MDEPFLGEIMLFAGNFAPIGWAFCNGQLLSISDNQALFSLLGTTYGGDGKITFALPDLRGRTPIHAGQGPGLTNRKLGARLGTETNMMTVNQLPVHTHLTAAGVAPISGSATALMLVNNTDGSELKPKERYLGVESGGNGLYSEFMDSSTLADDAISVDTSGLAVNMSNIAITRTGNNAQINNMQPWIAINYCIALMGIYPSRG